ncbi:hypothetical protein I7I53_06007 [Histoplasma capsulatum var. duboisii H88]|uniref:Uncharacterized protein n=1 Tax=Ajellomyces capsulatus (strain H88) TaxID=544711 RepID=A0A8A1LDB7_AJEC8|nr:hypothetical protein I7I53_06007 [Histoplasma capsulatum var. duboisii H88]
MPKESILKKGLLESGEHATLSFAMFKENPSRSNLSCGFYIIVAGLLFLHAAKFNTDCRPVKQADLH